jgi:hypothetical protein
MDPLQNQIVYQMKSLKYLYSNEIFANIVVKIINTCIIQEKVPKNWKNSNIYIIHKKDNPNNSLNYKPIALLNTTYKIYSSLITHRLSVFMEEKDYPICKGDLEETGPHLQKFGLSEIL